VNANTDQAQARDAYRSHQGNRTKLHFILSFLRSYLLLNAAGTTHHDIAIGTPAPLSSEGTDDNTASILTSNEWRKDPSKSSHH
jgi:hypothetical protein